MPVVAVAKPETAAANSVLLAVVRYTPVAVPLVAFALPAMAGTVALVVATSNLATGFFVPMPIFPPVSEIAEFPRVVIPVQRGIVFAIPDPVTWAQAADTQNKSPMQSKHC